MPQYSPVEWLALCTNENKLQISLRRHIHHIEDYIVKIDLAADELDAYGDVNDPRVTGLMSENAKAATELVMKNTSIPVPVFIEDGYIGGSGTRRYFSVWEYIDGLSLETEWKGLSTDTKERIMGQLHGYALQLKGISNPFNDRFAVGTLCSTHELLNDPNIPGRQRAFWSNNGPFTTVEEFKEKVDILYGREPTFSANTPSVFDHMDWFMCNVLIDHSRENVIGVLDWEKAGFIPDPEGSFLAGADESVKARLYLWLTLFDSR